MGFLERTLKYGTAAQKESIIDYINNKKIRSGDNLILKYFDNEKDAAIKKKMSSALITFSNKRVIPYLLELFNKENRDDLKIFAIAQLTRLKYRDSYKLIMDNIDSENEMLTEAGLVALGEMEVVEVVDKLIEKLEKEKSDRIRSQIILALANIKSEKAFNLLMSIFTNKDEKEIDRGYAITGLGYMKNKMAYDILSKYYINESSNNIKMRIIDALGNLGYKEAVDILIESLKDNERNIRIGGIRALGKLKAANTSDISDILKYKAEYDPDNKVREEAKRTLEELKEKNKN